MSADLETGFVPSQDVDPPPDGKTVTIDEEVDINRETTGPSGSELRASTHVSRVLKIEQKSTGGKKRARTASGEIEEAEAWKGRVHERIKLVQKGYETLAIICTFLAGVQASLLARTFTQNDVTAEIVNGFFFAGLVADIGAAILSAASQRWFEMIRREEAEHVFDYLKGTYSKTPSGGDEQLVVDEKTNSSFSQIKNVAEKESGEEKAASPSATFCVELWLFLALKAPPYAAILGFVFMVAGVMLWVWSHEAVVAKVLCTVLCLLLVMLLPPFAIQHDRKEALKRFKLKRFSG